MKISYKWLQDLIDVNISANDLAEKLTLVGLELDGMNETGDDFILDIETTSNRGDCLSHLGVAREVSALTGKPLKLENYPASQTDKQNSDLVTISDPDVCQRFTARVIRNVKISDSPEWLSKRLESIGERSINNVADITNYVMHELGQPMHAFDLDKLSGKKINVRRAKDEEKITTLDEFERKLDSSMLMICDTEKPVAVAGVMGGFHSGIDEETTDVLIEVAYFDRDSIRQTSKKLGLVTEASYHFERGVNVENLVRASNRATQLICDLADGTAKEFVDVYPMAFIQNTINAPNLKSEVKRLSGLDVEQNEIDRILLALGIEKLEEGSYQSPTWRHDLSIDEDLVEEVVRIVGYDKIGEELPFALSSGEYQPSEIRKRKLRRVLSTLGFDEAISYSFINTHYDEMFDTVPAVFDTSANEPFVSIKDPIIEGASRMRPSLLSGLLDAVKVNFNQQNKNVKLFEIGKVFGKVSSEEGLPNEQELLTIAISGDETFEDKALTNRQLDFYDAKGSLESAIQAANLPAISYSPEEKAHLQNGQSATIHIGGKEIGSIGKLSGDIASKYKFKQPVFLAEIDLQMLLDSPERSSVYKPLSKFPLIVRDSSLIVNRSVNFDEIRDSIASQEFDLCRNVEFVDVFEGKGMADDERSVTIRLEYGSDDRTLMEDEVEVIHEKIIQALETTLSVKQR